MRFRRRPTSPTADELAIALECGDTTHPATGAMVSIAQALRPNIPVHESHRASVRDRMLRTAELAMGGPDRTEDPGTRDDEQTSPTVDVHVAEVTLADGSMLRLADVEPIDVTRAREAADRMLRSGLTVDDL